MRIVDGSCLAATQHRLKELRRVASGPLPGKALVLYDPDAGGIVDLVPCEDAHVQERALISQMLPKLEPGDCCVGDRNPCTRNFIFDAEDRHAYMLVRQHADLTVTPLGPLVRRGTAPSGRVPEQDVEIQGEDGRVLRIRRIVIKLRKKARDGDDEIALLTTLPKAVTAKRCATLHAGRWRIETAFQELERDLNSEISTLG